MLRCIRKESYKILNLASLGYLKILRTRRMFSVVSNMKTARVYASFKYKTGTAPQLRDPWIKHKFYSADFFRAYRAILSNLLEDYSF